ncbi:MAG: hypothetical protein ACYC6B_08710 [Thermoleophilia bacterium]
MRSIFGTLIAMGIWVVLLVVAAQSMASHQDAVLPVGQADIVMGMSANPGWPDSDSGAPVSIIDRASLALAKSHLKQAEIAQAIYQTDTGCFAADLEALRTADPAVPDSVTVVSADCAGYVMESASGDSQGSVCTLINSGGRSEYHGRP